MKKNLLLSIFFLIGTSTLIYEVVWLRPLELIFGSTTYAISLITAAFMGGLALGAWLIREHSDKTETPLLDLAKIAAGIGVYGLLIIIFFNQLPFLYLKIYQNFYPHLIWFFISQFLLAFAVLMIPTTLMGMILPLAVKTYNKFLENIGKDVGALYSVNNWGGVLGALSAGLVLIPFLGIKLSIIIASFINLAIFLGILFTSTAPLVKKINNKILASSFLTGVILLTAFLPIYDIKSIARGVFIHHSSVEFLKKQKKATEILFYKETPYVTIFVHQVKKTGDRYLKLNGHTQCSNAQGDLATTRGLAVYPYETFVKNYDDRPKTAANIGLGCGLTSGWLAESQVKTTSFEIDPAVVEAAEHFKEYNWDVNSHKDNTTIIADARHWLSLHPDKKYDIIISEPPGPWTIQSTYLFSKEFFQIIKEHLTEKGIASVWVPIFAMNLDNFKIIYNTFHSVFPNVHIYLSHEKGNELIFLGSENPLTPVAINYLGNIGDYAKETEINTDDNPVYEFGAALHLYADYPREEIIKTILENKIQ